MIKITIHEDKLSIQSDKPRLLLIVSISDVKSLLNDRTKVLRAGIVTAIGSAMIWLLSHLPLTQPYYAPQLPPAPAQVQMG